MNMFSQSSNAKVSLQFVFNSIQNSNKTNNI